MVSRGINRCLASLFLALLGVLPLFAFDGEQHYSQIAEGDLLFVIPHSANEITIATGTTILAADHVAVCHRIGGAGGPLYIIEAISQGVTLTPIDSLFAREAHADIAVGRVAKLDVPRSVAAALSLLGRQYDFLYLPDNHEIYCSELVQLTYRHTDGTPVFTTAPMSFHDASGEITPGWREHYRRRGAEVPEGKPGTNPTGIATHPAVTLTLLRR